MQEKGMKKPTEEQLEKFWEWCGFRTVVEPFVNDSGYHGIGTSFFYPNSKQASAYSTQVEDMSYLYPVIDLNNLFKYAVPKLESSGLRIVFSLGTEVNEASLFWHVQIGKAWDSNSDPALALFWAIYKII